MQLTTKVALMLMLILIGEGLSTPPLLAGIAVRGESTQCPVHRQPSPSPSPIDHRCCQSGHDAAMLQKVANPQRDVLVAVLLRSDRKPVSHDVLALFSDEATSPGTPPAKLQLRI
jgi:hypothetical protein